MQTRIQPWDIRDRADLLRACLIGSQGWAQEGGDALSQLDRSAVSRRCHKIWSLQLKSWRNIKLGTKEESSFSTIKKSPQRHRVSRSDAQHLFLPCHRAFMSLFENYTAGITRLSVSTTEGNLFLQTLHTSPTTSGKNIEKQYVNTILNQCYSILLNYIILSNTPPADLEVLYSNYCFWSKEKWLADKKTFF